MKTLHEAKKALESASIWTWSRGDGTYCKGALSIYQDNYATDSRTIYEIRLDRGAVRCQAIKLEGYNSDSHMWTRYTSRHNSTLERKGEKALRKHIRAMCEEATGYPNPEMHTHYAKKAA